MAIIDIIKRPFRSFDGTKWIKHYFETSADQVKYTKKDGGESDIQTELTELNGKLQLISHPISPKDPDNLPLTCKRIGNKVIVDIGGGYQAFSRSLLVGWTSDKPIIYDANCIRFISGNGIPLALGYAEIANNTCIYVNFDRDLTVDGHIRGTFSYYIQ